MVKLFKWKGAELREIQQGDIGFVIDYFHSASPEFLLGMGADAGKLPSKEEWKKLLLEQLKKPLRNKEFYYIIWILNQEPFAHSNINGIKFGKEAYMHLHIWSSKQRRRGMGEHFIKKTLPYYFDNFELDKLYSEPSSKNPAPNKILKKIGFQFVREYQTTPGWISFHQTVNQWVMTKKRYLEVYESK